MELSVKRLVHIIACMAAKGAELVRDTIDEEYVCYIFLGQGQPQLHVEWEEVYTLIDAEIIDVDSGCDEPGHESVVYRLTETAVAKVQVLVDEEMKKRKKNKRLQ